MDLAAPALAGRITTQMVASGFARELSIEIKSVEPSMFAKKSQEAEFTRRSTMLTNDNTVEGAVAPQTSVKGKISDRRPLIMLDPGHGGPDTGAVGLNNISEKDVVMAFARDLRSLLESRGQFRVMMTRETDVFVPLDERVRMSRLNNASLFISIHADRLATATEVHGFTVYTGSEKATDAESAILADSENRADAMAGADPVAAREDISDILDDLVRRETRSHSSLFARTLLGRMEASGQVMNKNPHRSAGFRVLRAPDVPSVLLELGYLSSKTDISKLSDAAFRERMTLDIADAVQRFFASIQAQESQGVLPH
jgi:N-acetylmuramoyl-L-alanine amidase